MSDEPVWKCTEPGQTSGYARASTNHQVASPKIQEDQIRQYAEKAGLCPGSMVEMYVDPGISARYVSLDERPAGSILCRRLKEGDHVIFAKLDRGFRSLADFIGVTDDWVRRGVTIHVINMPGGGQIDMTTATGRMMMRILAVFAEFDNDLRRERILEALAARRAAGLRGTKHAPFGYMWSPTREYSPIAKKKVWKLVPNEIEREVARKVVLIRHTTGAGWEAIAQIIRDSGIQVPGQTQVNRGSLYRYYQKMRDLGMIVDGRPTADWKDPPNLQPYHVKKEKTS